jgi:YesN/AraC family two-component response regulator
MDSKLIEQLWHHTHQTDKNNLERYYNFRKEKEVTKSNPKGPNLLPSELFLSEHSSSIFMSFHQENSNENIHSHDFFELIYVCQGTPVSVINNQEIFLEKGNICVMNPNAVHYFKKYSEKTDLILNIVLPKNLFQKSLFPILFQDSLLNAFFIRYQLENENEPSFLTLFQLDQDVDHLIELLLKEYLNQGQYSQVVIESILTLIFSFILRNYKDKTSHDNHAMTRIMDYIYMNYQTVSLEYVAKKFNYHPKYLSTLIHKATGQTFRSLIMNIKLQNAMNFILYTDHTMEEIVELVGYKDKSSFYALFKKVYGMSPGEYRKEFSL